MLDVPSRKKSDSMTKIPDDKARLFPEYLLEALPYIRRFHGKTIVIKYGGAAMKDTEIQKDFVRDVVLLRFVGIRPVIVHGGGPKITQMMQRLGKNAQFIDGLRVTDKETVDIAEMVLAGTVNKEIVALINREGGRAVGLSGKDGGLISARKRSGPDLGFVGDVESVDVSILKVLDENGFIPVVSPLGLGSDGQSYNINADTVSGEIAAALAAHRLIILTDTPGILRDTSDPKSLISSIDVAEIPEMTESRVLQGGILPKIAACERALKAGVSKAHIIDGRVPHVVLLELFTDQGVGTEIVSSARAPAHESDAGTVDLH